MRTLYTTPGNVEFPWPPPIAEQGHLPGSRVSQLGREARKMAGREAHRGPWVASPRRASRAERGCLSGTGV